jgi:energy-converting hydrogenase Eha subunit F
MKQNTDVDFIVLFLLFCVDIYIFYFMENVDTILCGAVITVSILYPSWLWFKEKRDEEDA